MDTVRIGTVSSVDYQKGMVRVAYADLDDSVTDLLPVYAGEYKMPSVGDSVLVLHLSNGTSAGIVFGSFWSEANVPAEAGKGLYRKELGTEAGDAFLRYQGGQMTVKADAVTVKADELTFQTAGGTRSQQTTVTMRDIIDRLWP